jgi:hypothetical protein
LHVVTLLFSGVSREDGELVKLDAVHERKPEMYAKALVTLATHADPRILCVHLVNNPIALHLRLANDKATEQLVCLLGFCNSKVLLGLEGFLELIQLVFSHLFLAHSLVVREIEKRAYLLPNCNQRLP